MVDWEGGEAPSSYAALMSSGRRRRENSRDPQRRAEGIGSLGSPAKRLRPLFRISREMTDAVDIAIARLGPAHLGTQEQFERTILMRGANTLKAARLVAEGGHWEVAAVCARQIYELVLNMEALGRAENREEASITFARYGLLQKLLHQLEEISYDRDTGRPYDQERLDELIRRRDSAIFLDFRIEKVGKPVSWRRSWTGKTTWQLAEESSSQMRVPQYRNLFKRWSEEAHGAPSAHIDNMFRRTGEDWAEQVVKQDDRENSEVTQMAMLLFVDLWQLLPAAAPFPASQALDWSNRIFVLIEQRSGKIPEEYRHPKRPEGSYIIAPPASAPEDG